MEGRTTMPQFFEAAMIVFFGLSWPISVMKSWKSRTAKGKSFFFEILVLIGYLCGITGKFVTHNVTYVLVFYVINVIMISVDMCLYFRNCRYDRQAARIGE